MPTPTPPPSAVTVARTATGYCLRVEGNAATAFLRVLKHAARNSLPDRRHGVQSRTR